MINLRSTPLISVISKKKQSKNHSFLYLYPFKTSDTDDAGQKQLSGIEGGQSIQLPNMKDLADGEFMTAIEDGTLAFPSNVNVFFNYLQGTDKYEGRFQETTYTPNAEWNDIFLEGLDNVKNGSMTVDEYIEQVQPQMQASLDEAWESVE